MSKPDRRYRAYGYTKHKDAVAYAEKGWGKHGSREGYYSHLRYHGPKELPKRIPKKPA